MDRLKSGARIAAALEEIAERLGELVAVQRVYAAADSGQPLGPVGPPRGDAWEPPAKIAPPPEAPSSAPAASAGLPPAPAVVGQEPPGAAPLRPDELAAKVAADMAEAAKGGDLVSWDEPRKLEPALQRRFFAVLREAGLEGDEAKAFYCARLGVESLHEADTKGVAALAKAVESACAVPRGEKWGYRVDEARALGVGQETAWSLASVPQETKVPWGPLASALREKHGGAACLSAAEGLPPPVAGWRTAGEIRRIVARLYVRAKT